MSIINAEGVLKCSRNNKIQEYCKKGSIKIQKEYYKYRRGIKYNFKTSYFSSYTLSLLRSDYWLREKGGINPRETDFPSNSIKHCVSRQVCACACLIFIQFQETYQNICTKLNKKINSDTFNKILKFWSCQISLNLFHFYLNLIFAIIHFFKGLT